MSISAKINKAVLEHGTTRDALNVTMARLELAEEKIVDLERRLKDSEENLIKILDS